MKTIPEKPNLSLYFGQVVRKVNQSEREPWKWTLTFENGVVIQNYSPDETHPPVEFVGWKFISMGMSVHDTSLHFRDPQTGIIRKWGLKPTSYTIHDPKHGGEVIPQWPEELEERGISPDDIGKISDQPDDPEAWERAEHDLQAGQEAKRRSDAQEFLEDENGT